MRDKPKDFKFPELKEQAAYAADRKKLDRLEAALVEAVRRDEKLKFKANRASEEAKRHLARFARVLPTTDSFLDRAIPRIVESGDIPAELMAEVRSEELKIPLPDYDLEIISEVHEARAAIQLFELAIARQKREVSRKKDLAMAEIRPGLQSERQRIARALAGILLQFAGCLREEYQFVIRLEREIDPSFPALLSPLPFPWPLAPDPAIRDWLALALDISPADAEAYLQNASPDEMRKVPIKAQSAGGDR